jgi:hypothetical protein
MALTPDGNAPVITGNPEIARILQESGATQLGVRSGNGKPASKFDFWRNYWKPRTSATVRGPFGTQVPRWLAQFQMESAPRAGVRPENVERAGEAGPDRPPAGREEERERLRKLLREFLGREPTPTEMAQAWAQAVDDAEAADSIGIDQTPWDVLEHMAQDPERPASKQGPRTVTRTDRAVDLTDPDTAKAILASSMRSVIGRAPTDDEVSSFIAALNATEEANPTLTTTTQRFDAAGDLVESTSETSGGAPSPDAFAQSYLDEEMNAEIDVFRAATDYFNVAQQLTGSVV